MLTLTSMRPIHQICLEAERLRIAQAKNYMIRFTEWKFLISLRVDELTARVSKKAIGHAASAFNKLRYRDLREECLPRGRKARLQERSASDRPVFSAKVVQEPCLPGGMLSIAQSCPPDIVEVAPWSTINEPLDGEDDFAETTIVKHILEGNSCTVLGRAGTGKSRCLRLVEQALKSMGMRVAKIALTHVATRNCGDGAMTAHSWVLRHCVYGSFNGPGAVLVDEISMIPASIIGALEKLRLRGNIRIICFGDWDQLESVLNHWRAKALPGDVFQHACLYRKWSDSMRFVLRRCRRSDQAHFDFCSELIGRDVAGLRDMLAARFPEDARGYDWHLCVSHAKRVAINRGCQRKALAEFIARNQGERVTMKTQDGEYEIFAGTRLVGSSNKHARIRNGSFLTVKGISADLLRCHLEDDETNEGMEVEVEVLGPLVRLRHALVIHSPRKNPCG